MAEITQKSYSIASSKTLIEKERQLVTMPFVDAR